MAKKSKKVKADNDASASKEPKRVKKAPKPAAGTKKKSSSSKAKRAEGLGPDVAAVAKKVKAKAADLASNPLVAEVVAATLVAAAAAIKDPKKARAIAASAGDELGKAAKGAEGGAAMWKLAIEVAKRSMGALAEDAVGTNPKPKAKKKL